MTKLLKLLPLIIALALLAGVPAAVSGQETATVSFASSTYTVNEDAGSVSVKVRISNSVSFPVSVRVSTANGTAFARSDYTAVSTTVTFAANTTAEQEVDVTIVDSSIIEGDETFSLSLSRSPGLSSDITVSTAAATVTIEENDTATLALERMTYEVQETSRPLTICASILLPAISCPVNAPFTVQLSVTDGKATSPADYDAGDATGILNFGRCERRRCFPPISFINDRTVENDESFTVTLGRTGSTPDYITFDPAVATVEIKDDSERAVVGFESGAFTANAGDKFEIPVVISRPPPEQTECPVVFDFDVHISHPQGAFVPYPPDPPGPAGPVDPMVATFKACESTAEATATAAALNSFRTETFSLRLQRPSGIDPRIAFTRGRTTARLTVIPSRFGGLDAGNSGPWGMWSDRATVWVSDEDGGKIYAYNMNSMARDSDNDFDTLDDADNNRPTGIWSDGATMWVADYDDGKIYAYRMSDKARDDAKDFNTLTDAGNTAPTGIWSNGATMWVADGTGGKIYAYRMSDKARDDTKDFDTLTTAGNAAPTGIWSDGTTMWVADDVNDKIYAYSLSTKARETLIRTLTPSPPPRTTPRDCGPMGN